MTYRILPFSVTLNDRNPNFNGMSLFDVDISEMV